MRTLGEDIVLLALRQDGRFHAAAQLRLALSGAELVQLAALRRVTVDAGRVQVLDGSATGDVRLDAALADIAGGRRPPKASDWVARARRGHLDGYLAALADAGVLRAERRKALGLLPVTRWLANDAGPGDAARARLDRLALSDEPVEAVRAALGGLTCAIGLDRVLYPGRDGQAARKRLKLIATRDPASRAVGDAMAAAVDASVDAAVEASVHAAITASVHATHHAATAAHHDGGAGGGGGGHH